MALPMGLRQTRAAPRDAGPQRFSGGQDAHTVERGGSKEPGALSGVLGVPRASCVKRAAADDPGTRFPAVSGAPRRAGSCRGQPWCEDHCPRPRVRRTPNILASAGL